MSFGEVVEPKELGANEMGIGSVAIYKGWFGTLMYVGVLSC